MKIKIFICALLFSFASIIYLVRLDQYLLTSKSKITIDNEAGLNTDDFSITHIYYSKKGNKNKYDSTRLHLVNGSVKTKLVYGGNGFLLNYNGDYLCNTGLFCKDQWKPVKVTFRIAKQNSSYIVYSRITERFQKDVLDTTIVNIHH